MFKTTCPKFIIRRCVYNELVELFPEWMATVWLTLDRSWLLGGVMVFGCANSGLAEKLNAIKCSILEK